MSGVGKGVTTASIATILESKGYSVSPIKADPYLNVDAGTMNPTEHGEVFVLDSGLETDQDLGNYERFLGRSLPAENYMTNGMVFKHVIDKERALGYDGKCVEPTYHITEEIIRRIHASAEKTQADFTLIEIGGTIGEYQNAIFIEAGRVMKRMHGEDVMFVMVSYLPTPPTIGEMKTKPTQNATRLLNSYGVNPDMIIARAETPLDDKRKEKISAMCGVKRESVISAPDVDNIYQVPVNFEDDGLSDQILSFFDTKGTQKDLKEWRAFVEKLQVPQDTINVAIVGKYFDTGDFVLSDAYISVIEALKIAATHDELAVKIDWLDSKDFEGSDTTEDLERLADYDGVIVPGGFGSTGIEGKLAVIEYVRQHKIPYLGLCYGMQLAVVEYARNVLELKDAHTTEIDEDTPDPVITILEEQKENMAEGKYGGTMRLGSWPAKLKKDSIAFKAYSDSGEIDSALTVFERHRHRFEVNPEYVDDLEEAGFVFSGTSPNGELMEIAELPTDTHPFFVGTQFHPEFTARVLESNPLFSAFVRACNE